MKTEQIYSPINDENIKKDISNSSIWKECYTKEEIKDKSFKKLYRYTIKFEGTKPIQVTNIKQVINE